MQRWAYHSKREEQFIPSLQAGGVSLVYLKYKGGSRGPFITRLKKTLKDVGMACQKVCEQGRDNV